MLFKRLLSLLLCVSFTLLNLMPPAYAQALMGNDLAFLPEPGKMVALSSAVNPPILRGIKVFANDPLNFDFILDSGDKYRQDILDGKTPSNADPVLKETSRRLLKYFLTTLTVPDTDIWVNLSPHEKDRVISTSFGQTEMGRDILGQDYVLKQVTASLMSPESEAGKKFWARVYEEAQQKFGTTDIPVDTFNKVWIMPDKAVIYEKMANDQATAFVVESRLKVLLESDYFAMKGEAQEGPVTDAQQLSRDVLREVIVPILEKEVNEGENFALLRQAYHSILLALWYKEKMQGSILSLAYVNRGKVAGVDVEDKAVAQKIWQRYVQAYKKGVVNIVTEEKDAATDEIVPRKYFSGGFNIGDNAMASVKIIHTLGKYASMLLLAGFLVISAGCQKEEMSVSVYDQYFLATAGPINSTTAFIQKQITDDQNLITALNKRLAGETSAYDAYFSSTAGPISTVIADLQAQNTANEEQIKVLNQRLTGETSAYDAYFSSTAGPISTVIADLQAQNTANQQLITVLNQRLTGTTSAYDVYFLEEAGSIGDVIADLEAQNAADEQKIVVLEEMMASGNYTNYLLTQAQIIQFTDENVAAVTANNTAITYFTQEAASATGATLAFLNQFLDYLDENEAYLTANQLFLDHELAQYGSTPPYTPDQIVEEHIALLNQHIASNTSLRGHMTTATTVIVPNFTNYLLSEAQIAQFTAENEAAVIANNTAITYFTQEAASATGATLAFLNQFLDYLDQNEAYLTANQTFLNHELAQYGTTPPYTPEQIVEEQIALLTQQITKNTVLSGNMTTATTIIVPNFTNYLLSEAQIVQFTAENAAAVTANNTAITYFTQEAASATGATLAFLNQFIAYLDQNEAYLTANQQLLDHELAQYAATPPRTPKQIVEEQIAVLQQQIIKNTALSGHMTTATTTIVSNFTNYLLTQPQIAQFTAENEAAVTANKSAIIYFTGEAATASGDAQAFFNQFVAYLKQNGEYLTANQLLLDHELAQYGATPPYTPRQIIEEQIMVLNQHIVNNTLLLELMTQSVTIMVFDFAEEAGDKAELKPVDRAAIDGGVDMTRASTPLDVRNQGEAIHFRIDPAQIESINLAAGLAPQVYTIAPLPSLSEFLGMGGNGKQP